ncbi:MAG: phosphatase PAP2 family protein [Bacteroidota bacterium]
MIELIRKNRFFIIPYFSFLVITAFFLVLYSKSQIHIYLNQYHHPIADFIFKYNTHIGDGIAIAIFMLLLLFIRYRYFLIMVGSVFITTLVVQSFKRFILPDIVRPAAFFSNVYELYVVPGVKILTAHSFPSGHSATAFSIFLMAALISKNNTLKFLFFLIALIVAYSRVYLSHHFIVDIYFGSLISIIINLFMFYWGSKWHNPKLNNSLIKLIRNKKIPS